MKIVSRGEGLGELDADSEELGLYEDEGLRLGDSEGETEAEGL
jgi:hypothetical protein